MGWPVHPLKPNDKRPSTKHGLLDATTDQRQINTWWKRNPDYNIGLRTGVVFDVLDFDSPEAPKNLADVLNGYRHTGPISKTSKGWHYLFGVTGRRNGAALRPGVDFRGENGYIVAPPSIHPSGFVYHWVAEGEVPEPPEWLMTLTHPFVRVGLDPNKETPEAIAKALADLPGIVQAFAEAFPNHILRPTGGDVITNCPFHQDDTPSLVLYPRTSSFFCFGCRAWGDPLNIRHFQKTGQLR